MKRVTLMVVAVLLAVPVAAQAKGGIEFDKAIEQQQPGDRQTFTAMVMHEPSDPMGRAPKPVVGVHPLVTFKNERTGEVLRVRTSRTNLDGMASGSVTFPDSGPWTPSLFVGGHRLGSPDQSFSLTSAAPKPAPVAPKAADGGGLPAWVLSFPAAALVALGIWFLRRRPRELGA